MILTHIGEAHNWGWFGISMGRLSIYDASENAMPVSLRNVHLIEFNNF